jgi:hypothetical protein
MTDYYNKYLKYKAKYLQLKSNNNNTYSLDQLGSGKKKKSKKKLDLKLKIQQLKLEQDKLNLEKEKLQLEKDKLNKEKLNKDDNKDRNKYHRRDDGPKVKKHDSSSSSDDLSDSLTQSTLVSSDSYTTILADTLKNTLKPLNPLNPLNPLKNTLTTSTNINLNNIIANQIASDIISQSTSGIVNPLAQHLSINMPFDPTNNNPFIGVPKNQDYNAPYQYSSDSLSEQNMCNPEYFLNKVAKLTSEQILCFQIIIPYYKDAHGGKKHIDIPFIGISLKFPNYLFYVKGYTFNTMRKTGIYELIIYKMPNIPQNILLGAIQTPMWIEYYSSFIRHINVVSDDKIEDILNFNQLINFEHLVQSAPRTSNYISINYDDIIQNIY